MSMMTKMMGKEPAKPEPGSRHLVFHEVRKSKEFPISRFEKCAKVSRIDNKTINPKQIVNQESQGLALLRNQARFSFRDR